MSMVDRLTPITQNNGLKLIQWSSMVIGLAYSQGWRDYMQDDHSIMENIAPGVDYVGIFDGHDEYGHDVAEYLAKHLAKSVIHRLNAANFKGTVSTIKKAFVDFDAKMRTTKVGELGKTFNECRGGSTAVCCFLTDDRLIAAATGDSRAVMSVKGRAVDMSVDHKVDDPEELRRIERAGGFVEEGRVQGILAMTRAFGDYQFKDRKLPGADQMVTAMPDVKIFELSPALEFFVLASDGVWDVLSSQEVVDFVWSGIDAKLSLDRIAYNIIRRVIAPIGSESELGRDNITVAVCIPNHRRSHRSDL